MLKAWVGVGRLPFKSSYIENTCPGRSVILPSWSKVGDPSDYRRVISLGGQLCVFSCKYFAALCKENLQKIYSSKVARVRRWPFYLDELSP